MSADELTRPTSLPDDVAACHEMLEGLFRALAQREKRIEQLEESIDALVRQRYAPEE